MNNILLILYRILPLLTIFSCSIEYAMRMSMAQEAAEASAAEGAEKMDVDEQKGDEDYSEAMNDPAFLQVTLDTVNRLFFS